MNKLDNQTQPFEKKIGIEIHLRNLCMIYLQQKCVNL